MASNKYNINKTAFYSFSGSAAGIGVALIIYAILPFLSGTKLTSDFKQIFWIITILMFVILVFSTIYVIMDNSQLLFIIFRDKKSARTNVSTISDSETTPLSTKVIAEVSYTEQEEEHCDEKSEAIKESSSHNPDENTTIDNTELEEKRQGFQQMYVVAEFRNRPIYEVFIKLLYLKQGGEFFMRMAYTAVCHKKWLNEIPKYKDAETYFGTNNVGSKSNYNTQYNKRMNIPTQDIISMGKRLEDTLSEIEKEDSSTGQK